MARSRPRTKPPLEYSLLYTATLCLLALGAIMVYSASSAESLLDGSGDPSYYLKRYVVLAIVGLVVLHFASRHGLRVVKAVTPVLLLASFVPDGAVMLPGFGVTVNGATRWLGAGPVQFQPSELLKLSLVLFAAQLLAARPSATQQLRRAVEAAPDRGRARVPAAAQAAGHGHRAGDLLHDRDAAVRGRARRCGCSA